MPRYVLTGAPGAGKTAIVRALDRAGHRVVEEAATDVIALQQAHGRAAPEDDPRFLDDIVSLQRARQIDRAPDDRGVVFFDRSPACTLALARYLNRPVTTALERELGRVLAGRVYQRAVFFVRNQGFITPSAARRISLADSLAFERVHEEAYRELGFDLIEVPAGPLAERVAVITAAVGLRVPLPAG